MLGCKFGEVNVLADYMWELIDTCWDVNAIIKHDKHVVSRINRYMLGCKCRMISGIPERSQELIDTCWDVNKTT